MAGGNFDKLMSGLQKKTARIGVIGLGYVGLPIVLRFCEERFQVIGFDVDQEKVKSLKAGLSSMNQNILSAHKKHDDLKDDLEILKRKFEHLRKNTDLAPHAEKLENVNDDVSLAHEKLLELMMQVRKPHTFQIVILLLLVILILP